MFELEILTPELPSVKDETYRFTENWGHLFNSL